MTEFKITKLEAAKRQLETAINLFFSNGDDVSIHALASASSDVLKDIGKFNKKTTIYDNLISLIKKEKKKEVLDIINKPKMFFKHADQETNKTINFYPSSNDWIIFIAIEAYSKVNGKITPTMMAFRVYFYLKNPKILELKEDKLFWNNLSNSINLNDKETFEILIDEFKKKEKQQNN